MLSNYQLILSPSLFELGENKMVDCPFRDIRRVSRHGIRNVEQVCSIGSKGPCFIGLTEEEANNRVCNNCEVPKVMNAEHCTYLSPTNHFAMRGIPRTMYNCRHWNEGLGNLEAALEKCKNCDDYTVI